MDSLASGEWKRQRGFQASFILTNGRLRIEGIAAMGRSMKKRWR